MTFMLCWSSFWEHLVCSSVLQNAGRYGFVWSEPQNSSWVLIHPYLLSFVLTFIFSLVFGNSIAIQLWAGVCSFFLLI